MDECNGTGHVSNSTKWIFFYSHMTQLYANALANVWPNANRRHGEKSAHSKPEREGRGGGRTSASSERSRNERKKIIHRLSVEPISIYVRSMLLYLPASLPLLGWGSQPHPLPFVSLVLTNGHSMNKRFWIHFFGPGSWALWLPKNKIELKRIEASGRHPAGRTNCHLYWNMRRIFFSFALRLACKMP